MPAHNKFSDLTADKINTIIDTALKDYRDGINKILKRHRKHNFGSLMIRLERLVYEFGQVWQPISHLNDVKKTPEYSAAIEQAQKKVSEFHLDIFQNKKLFKQIKKLEKSHKFKHRPPAEQALIKDYLRNFKLSGIELSDSAQAELKSIRKELTELKELFSNNKTAAIDAWTKLITDESDLSGVPESTKQAAKELAESKQQKGWLLTLAPNVLGDVVRFADSRSLREEISHAHNIAGSAEATDPEHNNSPIMVKILALKQREANLLGFKDHVDLSLSSKMATRHDVDKMLMGLAKGVRPQAELELKRLRDFAKSYCGIDDLRTYDIAYVSNKLKETAFSVDEKKIKEYFPADFVLSGMFGIVKQIFGISIVEETKFDKWDPEVKLFSVYAESGDKLGEVYMDLFARNGEKRGGAWMNQCEDRFKYGKEKYLPIAFLNTNFGKPTKEQPALLSHREVQTTFHEFGHCLHHILSQINFPSIAGPNGVPWDAVEAPSQMMENWIWDPQTLKMLSQHYKTGESLPDPLIEAIGKSRNYNAALNELQQLCYAMFDFKLHTITSKLTPDDIQRLWLAARNTVHVIPTTEDDHMPNTFGHIFAGAYSAGYYGYNWALNISHNLFNEFKQQGIMDPKLGRKYVETILAPGGSQEFMALVKTFLGKDPDPKALAEAIKSDVLDITDQPQVGAFSSKSNKHHTSHTTQNNDIKHNSIFTRVGKHLLPASLSASKFFIPALLGLIPVGLSLIPATIFPFALPIGLVSGIATGAIVFVGTLAVSLVREKMKNNALDYYKAQSNQSSPNIDQMEVNALKLGMDAAQSPTTQAMSCFQWQAYSSAYYAGIKAQETGEDGELRQKFQI
tara:strand:- start:4139 stop:6697 length:2559 start_codon:yes stop_codon:yes gene_type:complete